MHLLKIVSLAVLLMAATGINADVPKPKPIHGEGQCVEPEDDMKRNHMEYILQKGIRTSKHSLKQCISCHAVKDDNGEYVRIDDPSNKHFCATCHEFAAVSIDCFQCHADTPRSTDKHELRVNK
jgi:hypothetical protein